MTILAGPLPPDRRDLSAGNRPPGGPPAGQHAAEPQTREVSQCIRLFNTEVRSHLEWLQLRHVLPSRGSVLKS
eukprot:scaffold145130_cov33-Prasinocladus_malaysianus.AAC.2